MASRFPPSKLIHTYLDEDLWINEILNRLRIKTLCRIRCVCKSWNSLISSTSFITHHLSTHPSSKSYLLFPYAFRAYGKSYAFYNPQDSSIVEHRSFMRINSAPNSANSVFNVVDVIHGVVCLSRFSLYYTDSIILWNPTIHKYVEFPRSPYHGCFGRNSHVLGFGFDARRNDFKVVRIWGSRCRGLHPTKPPAKPATYEVVSGREGKWRKGVALGGRCALLSEVGCFTNGAIHWIVVKYVKARGRGPRRRGEYKMFLLVFDCERDEFETMELPREIFNGGRGFLGNLFMYRGMLSGFTSTEFKNSREFELWAMEEYGIASSWKKQSKTNLEEGFVWIVNHGVYRAPSTGMLNSDYLFSRSILTVKELVRLKQPSNGRVFEESMYLMDVKIPAVSYTIKRYKNGMVYYEKDGRQYEHLPIPSE